MREREGRGKVERKSGVADPTLIDTPEEDALLAQHYAPNTVRPVVDFLPPNFRLVMCTVGPHRRVRVMVRPNNQFYTRGMVIPLDVNLYTFDPRKLLIYNGNPPRRKGMW